MRVLSLRFGVWDVASKAMKAVSSLLCMSIYERTQKMIVCISVHTETYSVDIRYKGNGGAIGVP